LIATSSAVRFRYQHCLCSGKKRKEMTMFRRAPARIRSEKGLGIPASNGDITSELSAATIPMC
jgi:hypothetical protein